MLFGLNFQLWGFLDILLNRLFDLNRRIGELYLFLFLLRICLGLLIDFWLSSLNLFSDGLVQFAKRLSQSPSDQFYLYSKTITKPRVPCMFRDNIIMVENIRTWENHLEVSSNAFLLSSLSFLLFAP